MGRWAMVWASCLTLFFQLYFCNNASVAELVALCEEENDVQLETKIHVKMPSTLIFWNFLFLFPSLFNF